MAAVEGLLYCGDYPGNDYGSTTTQPWTIGWDEKDTQIRLNLIARAWIASRTSMRPEGAYRAELVRERRFFHPSRTYVMYMAVVVQ